MPLPETIIFGGAFDPPHIGHVQCVTAVKNRFPGCKVKVLPAFEPAQSAGQSKKTAASYDDRMQLCLLAFGDEVEVSDFEASLPRPNYTLNTISKFNESSNQRLAFLIGQDQLINFPKWQGPQDLLAICDLIVARRDSSACPEELRDDCETSLKTLGITWTWNPDQQCYDLPDLNSHIFMVDESLSPATSTHLRDGENWRQWMPPQVKAAVEAKGLYQNL